MKAYTAKYKYGFLYDVETGQRILLAEGSDLTVTVKSEDVLQRDPYNYEHPTLSTTEKLAQLRKKGYKEVIKLESLKESL